MTYHLLSWIIWECHLSALRGRITRPTYVVFPQNTLSQQLSQTDLQFASPGWVFLLQSCVVIL